MSQPSLTPLSHHAPVPQPTRSTLQPIQSASLTPSSGPVRRSQRSRPSSHAVSPAPQAAASGSASASVRYQPYPQRTTSSPALGATGAQVPSVQQPVTTSAVAATGTNPYAAALAGLNLPQLGPNPRIPRPQKQALYTTFPSRLRTGTTLLVQPLHLAPSGPAAAATSATALPLEGGRSRRGQKVNYAELDSFSEESESSASEEADEGDSDYAGEGVARASVGARGAAKGGKEREREKEKESTELERSWLGEPPPGRYVTKQVFGGVQVPFISQESIDRTSQTRECLIPIRVEFDTPTHRIRDSFLWNLYEPHLQPETFATQFIHELGLAGPGAEEWRDQVVAMIRAQVEDQEGVATFGEEEVELLERGRDGGGEGGGGAEEEENVDCRVFLNLDVQISTYHLMDTIEYSLDPTSADVLPPSLLAHTLAADLSLPPSSKPLIAHALTEELLRRKKDAIDSGILGGIPQSRAKPKEGVGIWREVPAHGWVPGGTPRLEVLAEEEVERREVERERAIRRLRRETARQLPVRRRR